jgi:hypothetical protein
MRELFPAAVFACAACATDQVATDNAPPPDGSLSFVVIGDTPYGAEDEEMLAAATARIRDGAYPFVIHIGDYKGGSAPCTTDLDDRFAALVESLKPAPVFYTPGDNEWTDCDRKDDPATRKPWSELGRLAQIRERFFADAPLMPKAFEHQRQQVQVENATWRHEGVRFATLHVVGTANGRAFAEGDPLDAVQAAVEAREAANAAWIAHVRDLAIGEEAHALVIAMQADPTDAGAPRPCDGVADEEMLCDAFIDLRKAIRDAAIAFGKPTLVIHGDTAPFTLNQDFAGDEAPALWRLNAAGDAGTGITGQFYGTRDVTVVMVNAKSAKPFAARGLVTGKTPNAR